MNMKGNQNIHTKSMKIAYAGLLTALGLLLPQVFHVFGQNAGMMFLPIHIPVLLAGILLGPYYGTWVGIIVPVLGCLFTAMPPVPKVYFMVLELAVYGLVTGLVSRKYHVCISLVLAMVMGRAAYGLALVFGVKLLHMSAPFMNQAAFVSGIISGIPGVAIQLVVIPVLYYALRKGGFCFEKQTG